MIKDISKIMTWHIWKVTYLRRNVTIVCGASYHLLGSQISWDLKIRFWLQVKSYISDWQFSKSQHLARYVSRHNAMAYDIHTYILRVQYSCGIVLVFCFWWEIVFGVTYSTYLVLSVQYSFAVVSVFLLCRELVLKMRTPFDFLWAVSTKKSYWVTLLWSASRCVCFVRPNTLLLCIFSFCIFLLYRTNQQVEVQIRILLKDKYVKLCQNTNTGNHTLISWTMLIGFLYFRETTW